MKRICTICAREGSKGVKNKNIRVVAGLTLVEHSLRQARQSEMFDSYAVSSDSRVILDIAERWGALAIRRPDNLATDTAPKLPAIRHCFLEAERLSGMKFDTLCDLDVTSPLRDVEDIQNAVNLLEKSGACNVITGCESRRSPYFNMVEVKDGGVHLSKPLPSSVTRRQDAPKCYDMNASIYVWRRDTIVKCDALFQPDTAFYEMPFERSLDIDSEFDFEIVSHLIEKRTAREGNVSRPPTF
ncbi:MAG: acylneuraminate cytidylyltransferase family protein [Oligoflexales bacterium]|nr:acylneuraminate cytidylyltransferase family protein [Oligoflexales bacterium]